RGAPTSGSSSVWGTSATDFSRRSATTRRVAPSTPGTSGTSRSTAATASCSGFRWRPGGDRMLLTVVVLVVATALVVGAVWGAVAGIAPVAEGLLLSTAAGALVTSVAFELVEPAVE